MEGMPRIVRRIPITIARINLGQVARRAHVNREYFILEKDGIPVAGILSADELEDFLEMQEPGLKAQIRKSHEEYRRGKGRDAAGFVAELRGKTPKRKK
jgi:PHD/YefM family antitoxin component YafN of YafNO toxin-antitoxin module